jgi:hypothetical protein
MVKKLSLILSLYFLLIMSSPLLVLVDADKFTEWGWLAIGSYSFEFIDGFVRSYSFFISTLPVVFFIVLAAPKNSNKNIVFEIKNTKQDSFIYHIFFYFLCVAYIWFFSHKLGINGVVTESEYRLSGLVYYFRSYVGLLLISVYILKIKNPSFLMILVYSIVSGFTSASRFVVVIPFVIYWIKFYYLTNKNFFSKVNVLTLILIFLLFTFITNIRVLFYLDDFLDSNFLSVLLDNDLNDFFEIFRQGFSQLILRLGVGRDVILSYEIAQNGLCLDYMGLFFGSGSCYDPPFDFYGLKLDSHRFYLAPPQLSSLYIISDDFFIRIIFSVIYGFMLFIVSRILWLLLQGRYTSFMKSFAFIFVIIFSLIGPVLYLWYLLLFSFLLYLFESFLFNVLRIKSN